MEPAVVPETDEVNQVDAAGSRLSEGVASVVVAVAVVSLAVRDGDDAGTRTLVDEFRN